MLLITGPQRARSKINWPRAVLEPAIVLATPEKETAPVEALELAIGPVVPAVRVAVVVSESPAVPVALERELGPVAAELVLAQLAEAPRTKSVTTAHHPGLVPLLTGEDLAAAAETTREPVAAEAAIAWAVAE